MVKQHNDYYTYAYLREDKTPYYIGKGRGNRAYDKKRTIKAPTDKSRILFLKKNLTEAEAFKHEVYMIFVLGRKDLGTGILRNRTNGGEGASGAVHSEEQKRKNSAANSGEKNPRFNVAWTEEQKKAQSERMTGKCAGEKNPMFGALRTKEWKQTHSERMTGDKNPQYGKTGALHHSSKAIIAIEPDGTQRHYGSIIEAARELEIAATNLCQYLKTSKVLKKGKFKDWSFAHGNQ